ncbi:MAG: D-2-hydroxyacid dehydrogenase [Acidobacteria bacterium]|nr:D-2-hydroxyacid dehydrogenase [Acidobacteriota bacterium]
MNVLVSIQQPVRAWQIPQGAVASLRERFPHVTFVHAVDAEQRADGLPACEVAYTWILSAAELARAPRLRWVHTSAVAVETLCLPELFARGVLVSNTRGVQATPIAEHVFATVLALAKQLPFALEQQRHARWAQNEFAGDRLPWLLRGRTLGLIGVGTIGGEIARLARAFGMTVIATRRARMKRGSVLVNVGRARIVQTAALVDALHAGHLAGASLDVYPQEPLPSDHPLWTCPNIILTPHTSGFRHGHWEEVVELFADNLMRFEKGEEVQYRVREELGY